MKFQPCNTILKSSSVIQLPNWRILIIATIVGFHFNDFFLLKLFIGKLIESVNPKNLEYMCAYCHMLLSNSHVFQRKIVCVNYIASFWGSPHSPKKISLGTSQKLKGYSVIFARIQHR